MKPSILTTLNDEKIAAGHQYMSRESFLWLTKKINDLRSTSRYIPALTKEKNRYTKPTDRSKFLMGGLYFFLYDPKTKDDLPYYDRFPMVLPLKRDAGGFLGLNLHYLPLKYRIIFFRKLLPLAIYNEMDEIKRIRITYAILDSSRKYKEFKPCIKQYLYSNIRSRILAVEPQEWDVALHLPIHQFRKEQAKQIWKESLEQARE
jgi:hypothetical protein